MSLNKDSKHYDAYYEHILKENILVGNKAKVYDIIHDISDRRGLKQEWNNIDGDIQDEIIETWLEIIEKH